MKLPQLSILIIPEEDYWVAVGLEHFMVAQAETPVEAIEELRRLCEVQPYIDEINRQEAFALIPRAPEAYWKMFNEARALLVWRGAPHPFGGEFRMAC
jgi:hypothetical protein